MHKLKELAKGFERSKNTRKAEEHLIKAKRLMPYLGPEAIEWLVKETHQDKPITVSKFFLELLLLEMLLTGVNDLIDDNSKWAKGLLVQLGQELVKASKDQKILKLKGTILAALGLIQAKEWIEADGAPASVFTLIRRAMVLSASQTPEQSLALFDEILRMHPNYFEAWYFKAVALYRIGRLNESLTLYKAVLKKMPGDPASSEDLADLYARQDNYQSAEACLVASIRRNQNDAGLYYKLAHIYYRQARAEHDSKQRFQLSEEDFYVPALEKGGFRWEATSKLANFLLRLDKGLEAIAILIAFVRKNPEHGKSLWRLASLQSQMERYRPAEVHYITAMKYISDPNLRYEYAAMLYARVVKEDMARLRLPANLKDTRGNALINSRLRQALCQALKSATEPAIVYEDLMSLQCSERDKTMLTIVHATARGEMALLGRGLEEALSSGELTEIIRDFIELSTFHDAIEEELAKKVMSSMKTFFDESADKATPRFFSQDRSLRIFKAQSAYFNAAMMCSESGDGLNVETPDRLVQELKKISRAEMTLVQKEFAIEWLKHAVELVEHLQQHHQVPLSPLKERLMRRLSAHPALNDEAYKEVKTFYVERSTFQCLSLLKS